MPAAAVAAAPAPARDVRVDRIGYVQDLTRLWAEPMRKDLKARLLDEDLVAVEGDYYEGTLAAPPTLSTVDPLKFFKLYKSGKITEKDFVSAIEVNRKAAAQFILPKDLAAISTTESGEPRFTITRKKGLDVSLATAVANVGNALANAGDSAAELAAGHDVLKRRVAA